MNRDFKVGLFIIVIALLFMVGTETLKPVQLGTDPGPKVFPRIAYIGLLISGLGIAILSKKESVGQFLVNRRVITITLLVILYTVSLQYLGYFVSTLWFVFSSYWFLSEKKYNRLVPAILTSLITTVSIYILFNKVFEILLPRGQFNFLNFL